MKFETDRIICNIHDGMAHVCFKAPEVAEYSEACLIGQELRRIVGGYEFRVMLIDCEVFNSVTSTVLEAFVSVHLRCRKQGREVRIANVNPLIRETLRTTRIDQIVPVFDTLEEALARD